MKFKREHVTNEFITDYAKEKLRSDDLYIHLFLDGYERLCNLHDAGILTLEYLSIAKKSINVYYRYHYFDAPRQYDTLVGPGYTFAYSKKTSERINHSQYHPNKYAKVTNDWYNNGSTNMAGGERVKPKVCKYCMNK